MDNALLAVSLLAGLEAVVMVVLIVILRRVIKLEENQREHANAINGQARQLMQLHRESRSDLTSFAKLAGHIQRIEDYVSGDLGDQIDILDLALRAHLKGHDQSDEETRPTQVQARTGSYVGRRGRGGADATARRRRV